MKQFLLLLFLSNISVLVNAQVFSERQKIVASDRDTNDMFASKVAVSGNYMVVTAGNEDEDASGNNFISNAGSAYIFERDGIGNWNEVQKIVASDRSTNDYFGSSVSIYGDYIVVGASSEDEDENGINTLLLAGSAYIFERNGSGTWNEVQKIVASDRAAGAYFGQTVSVYNNYLIVGALFERKDASGAGSITDAGAAYIFERDGSGTWNEVQKIVASDRNLYDNFGSCVSVYDNYAAIGAHSEDEDATGGNTLNSAGSVYVFKRDGSGTWNEIQKLVASDRNLNDMFGLKVIVYQEYIVAGAHLEDEDENGNNTLLSAGSAYVFKRDGSGVWNQIQKLVASDRGFADGFGTDISMSGKHIVISAPSEDEDNTGGNTMFDAGSVYIFEQDVSGTWNEIQKIVAPDRTASDRFGNTLGISGKYLVVGASREDENEFFLNTIPEAGSAYIFEYCEPFDTTLAEVACEVHYFAGNGIMSSGVYYDTLMTVMGCDSVIALNLIINNSVIDSSFTDACDSFMFGDIIRKVSGEYKDTLFSSLGCDSILVLNLVIHKSDDSTDLFCFSLNEPVNDDIEEFELFIPNAISINNDFVNDKLFVKLEAGTLKYFRMYNRFGKLLLNTYDLDFSFANQEKNLKQGVCIYEVEIQKFSGEIIRQKGTITFVQ